MPDHWWKLANLGLRWKQPLKQSIWWRGCVAKAHFLQWMLYSHEKKSKYDHVVALLTAKHYRVQRHMVWSVDSKQVWTWGRHMWAVFRERRCLISRAQRRRSMATAMPRVPSRYRQSSTACGAWLDTTFHSIRSFSHHLAHLSFGTVEIHSFKSHLSVWHIPCLEAICCKVSCWLIHFRFSHMEFLV